MQYPLHERIICICGNNGKGKTNLLDAIYYSCFSKSYFTRNDQQNVLKGHQGFRIDTRLNVEGEPVTVSCILRENGKKELRWNEVPYDKFSQHIGKLPCVMIAPDDIALITDGSEERRKFLDGMLSQLYPVYLQQLIEYNKVLQQRNSLLKSMNGHSGSGMDLLGVYNQQLIPLGKEIFATRKAFLEEFLPVAGKFYEEISRTDEPITLQYQSRLHTQHFESLLQESLSKDIALQRTSTGIHRDDLGFFLFDLPFKQVASQGQRKSLLFALKLAEFEILRQHKGFAPILLMDDVFEKLDADRMHHLLDWVCQQPPGPIFITDTHPQRIKDHFSKIGEGFQLIEL